MKIVIGADHGGYKLKEEIKKYLEEKNISYEDKGAYSEDSVDYPDIAKAVASDVSNKKADIGILICRSGIGMSMCANKFKDVRCAVCYEEQTAKFSRMHNNANMLALGADYISVNDAVCILRQFLATEFEGGRHQRRVDIINEIEKENMK
ncbi:MAG: ribose 5-phosphate isomerase B [Clostridia bacterium]|nr:ribose 5-phosphate isomerase B [Clostridia bacterium]